MILSLRMARAAALVLTIAMTASATSTPLSADPIVVAVKNGDCAGAVDLVNRGAGSGDGEAAFLGGRMLDEGICVHQDAMAATPFFLRGATLGDRRALLEYGARLGVGQGVERSYEHAGDVCRIAGLDPQKQLTDYSLGYVCTLRGLASKFLRAKLPAGAFIPDSGSLIVEVNASSAQMSVVSTPHVVHEEPTTGSLRRRQRVDARGAIEDAWQRALNEAPKPDAARLESKAIQVQLDVDMSMDTRDVEVVRDPDHTLSPLPAWDMNPRSIIPHTGG